MIERQKDTDEAVVMAITTFSDSDEARQIGTKIIGLQLAACVNVLPGVESVYRWQGRIEVDSEIVVLMKTTRDKVESLGKWLLENHPYDEPEFVVLPVEAGSAGYLNWVRGISH